MRHEVVILLPPTSLLVLDSGAQRCRTLHRVIKQYPKKRVTVKSDKFWSVATSSL